VLPTIGVPPLVFGCGVVPVPGSVISVQTWFVVLSMEKKPVPSLLTVYFPVKFAVNSQVWPMLLSFEEIMRPVTLPAPSKFIVPSRNTS